MQPAERQKVFIEPDLSLDRIKKNLIGSLYKPIFKTISKLLFIDKQISHNCTSIIR